jgi:hypothetical protein
MVEFDPDTEWDLMPNGSYDMTQDALTREVNLTYSTDTSTKMNLTIYEYNSVGSYTPVVSDSDTRTSGTISVTVPMSVGNKTFFAVVEADDEFINSEWVDMEDDAGLYFGNSLALFLAFLIILCLVLMAVTEGGSVVIWLIIGLIFSSVFGLVDYRTPTGAGLLIYFICAGGILLWKLAKKNR